MAHPFRVRYHAAVSMDGFIASPDGGVEWLDKLPPATDMEGVFEAFMASLGGMVVGRTTFEKAMSLGWAFGDLPTVVMTRRPYEGPLPPSVQLVGDDPEEALAALARRGISGDIWLMGGGVLATTFLEKHLLHGVEPAVIPVLVGSGIPFLKPFTGGVVDLKLTESRAYNNGLVWSKYEVIYPEDIQ